MSNRNLRQKLYHATVLYETKREWHDNVVQERDDGRVRARIKREWQPDDDAAVRVQIEWERHSDDVGDDKGVDCVRFCAKFVQWANCHVGTLCWVQIHLAYTVDCHC